MAKVLFLGEGHVLMNYLVGSMTLGLPKLFRRLDQ